MKEQASIPAVSEELRSLVCHHIDGIADDLHGALCRNRFWAGDLTQWQGAVLCKLTSAMIRLNLLTATIAAHMRHAGASRETLAQCLQIDMDDVDVRITDAAQAHLDGLTGEPPSSERQAYWHEAGRRIAAGADELTRERLEALEALLASMYSGHQDNVRALDYLPQPLYQRAARFAMLAHGGDTAGLHPLPPQPCMAAQQDRLATTPTGGRPSAQTGASAAKSEIRHMP